MASMNKCFNSMCIKQMHHWSIPTWAAFQVLWVVDARAAISFNISTQKVPKSVHEHLCCTRSYPFISSKYENLTTFLQLLLAVCHLFDKGFLPKRKRNRETRKTNQARDLGRVNLNNHNWPRISSCKFNLKRCSSLSKGEHQRTPGEVHLRIDRFIL